MNVLHVTDTRIASSLLGLGFAGELFVTINAETRENQYEVQFRTPSTRWPLLNPHHLVNHWRQSKFLEPMALSKDDELPADPMHVMAVAMRAQMAMDAILKAQAEGSNVRIEPVNKELHAYNAITSKFSNEGIRERITELSLAASLTQLGFDIRITGSPGSHAYLLPMVGDMVRFTDGNVSRYILKDLIRKTNVTTLALEVIESMHPLVIAYDAMQARASLKKEINRASANLLINAGDGSQKQALITLNAKAHVKQAVERHLKAAPGSLDV